MKPLEDRAEAMQRIVKAALIGLGVSLGPLVLATLVMAIIDDDSGPKYPYDVIHGALTAIAFMVCAFVTAILTWRFACTAGHPLPAANDLAKDCRV
jgi:hypothetical protein